MDDLPTLGEKMATFNVDPVVNLYLYFRILVFLGSPLPSILSCILVILTLGTEQHPKGRYHQENVTGHVSELSLPSILREKGHDTHIKRTFFTNHGISIDPAHSANV